MHRPRGRVRDGRVAPASGTQGEGRFQAAREGFGFVIPDRGAGGDVYIPPEETAGALHRDRVAFEIIRPAGRVRRAQGVVLRILERGFARLTGVVAGTRKHPYLIPDHPRLPPRFRLVGPRQEIEPGQRILCELQAGGRPGHPAAMPLRILGDADDARLDEEIVIAEYGLPGPYPQEAVAEAERYVEDAPDPDAELRRDFTREPVLTIDPADARDFDDAVSIAKLPQGGWRVRVHIADVTVAVPPESALDAEARARGNSTYLPGRMIPMLPGILAADRMSLAPEQRRHVVTISARLARDGAVVDTRVDLGTIRSGRRFDYGEVRALLEDGSGAAPPWDAQLRELDAAAQALRQRRFARGSWDLDVPETVVRLGPTGMPQALERRSSDRSHQMIEELMILANRIACAYARRHAQPYLYRVHPPPGPLAVEEFAAAVPTLAPQVRPADLRDLPTIRNWLANLPRGPLRWRIHALFLQAMQRAVYAPEDQGHFGLGLQGYGHFTSPIRRYADLFNHRVVKWVHRWGHRPLPAEWQVGLEELARGCSAKEERSERAERTLTRIKVLRWAEARCGSSYRGTIVGVLPAGYLVEFDEVPVEGFAPRAAADHAVRQDTRARSAGPGRGGLQTSDPVIAQIARVDRRERRLELILRAAGRRAQTIDPGALEAVVDEEEQ
ncbi:MAG: RNB domain-containing ribonuclease, partial [Candidatus Eisenbacteria bacterium]|nr:RNB domain-containing ribonuclease [Candidatus Eisenbacteria bacterium]